jgi:putative FmdB family regulatory protein
MPVYEYRCLDCRRRFDKFLTYQEYDALTVLCSYCGSQNVTRKIGRIRISRSDESRMENLSNFGNMDNMEKDPVALGRMMRQMSSEVGEEMPAEFDEVVNRLEAGQSPEDIEQDMPELGSDQGDSGGFGGDGGLDF